MRLIDADALVKQINKIKFQTNHSEEVGHFRPFVDIANVLRCINEQPTAFNVDKVVEELVDTFGDDICEMEGNFECDADIPCDECKRNRMLELVRRGGV